MHKLINFAKYNESLNSMDSYLYTGVVKKVIGLSIEAKGPITDIGDICKIYSSKNNNEYIKAEVVGFSNDRILLMPLDELEGMGIGIGSKVVSTNEGLMVGVGKALKGRVLNGLGEPIDGKGEIKYDRFLRAEQNPPNPLTRKRIKTPISLGIKAIDGLLTCGEGQRMGVFSGSGVGKSTLLGMIARNSEADINVIVLVGERGREVRDFIEKDLKEEGLKKSILVIATSDVPALVRIKAAKIATTIAEYFRDEGKKVLFLMDSITRFCMAQREIGLAIGEPPVARGYPPSVFVKLPKLLERTGFSDKSSITAIYTVLVEGDEMNEPISDSVRGILDGHIVLSRKLATMNHYPAIDVLNSVSRLMPSIVDEKHYKVASHFKDIMSSYQEAKDMISIGAYNKGADKKIDLGIEKLDMMNEFLTQSINEDSKLPKSIENMNKVFGT